MISKSELLSIPSKARQLARDKEHYEILREKAYSVPSTTYGRERVQNTVENRSHIYADAAIDLAKEIRAEQAELDELKDAAREWISTLDTRNRRMMTYRYIDCQTWDMTACLMGYTERHTRRLARRITAELA